MNSTTKKWYESFTVKLIIVPIIVAVIGSGVYDFVKKVPILSSAANIIKITWNGISAFFQIDFKLWFIAVSLIVFVAIRIIFIRFKKQNVFPTFYRYNQDNLKVWKWSWEYQFDVKTHKWIIKNLIPFCPKCDTRLLYQGSSFLDSGSANCPRCQTRFTDKHDGFEDRRAVEALIIDNIERGHYAKD